MSLLDICAENCNNCTNFSSWSVNTPQKFFGFILLPVLSFLLGLSLSGEIQDVPKRLFSFTDEAERENTHSSIDTEIFRSVLKQLQGGDTSLDRRTLREFRRAVEDTEQLISQMKKVNLDVFWEALDHIEQKYVDPDQISFEQIAQGAIRGMVFSLGDEYSAYLSPEESTEAGEILRGELDGIGAELIEKNDMVTVVSPLRNSPAARAGILPEDVIVEVDGESVMGMSLQSVVEQIRGEKGTQVTLGIVRSGESQMQEISVIREHIIVESVNYSLDSGIAILEVAQFGERTTGEFETYLRRAIDDGAQGIVLDVRFNPGGYLDTAVDMVSAFVKEGKVVVQQGRGNQSASEFVTGKIITDLPLVVLINGGSASASEIVAGALQDYERAIVLGETSFGKGTVQEPVELSDASSLRITVAKWLTPKGRNIGDGGIVPDIVIERTQEDFENERDPQMDAALRILRGESSAEELGLEQEDDIILNQ